MTNIRAFSKIDGVQGQGDGAREIVVSDSRRTEDEDHAKRDFVISVGAAVTGIWQAW